MSHNTLRSNLFPIEPIERASTLPSSCYTDPKWHSLDVEHILKPRWQYVGHITQLENDGDVLPVTILGEPVIIARNQGFIQAFYNVCKHRGGPLATEFENCKMLQCKYHGWTYKLDGSLRGVPKFKYAELFDKQDYGLTSIPIQIWEGLIFIRLGVESEPLSKQIGGIKETVYPLQISNFIFHTRVSYSIGCNWKVYADNYLEGYHIPHVHPELCELLDMDSYKTVVNDWQILQDSPLIDKQSIYQGGDERAWYYFIYPNMMLNILPGRMQLNQILPVDERRCVVHFDYFYAEETLKLKPDLPENDATYSNKVQAEDTYICEHVQMGLQSSVYDSGRFSVETEQGVYAFQSLVKIDYNSAVSGNTKIQL
jgi:choline monooxygenase